MIIAVAVRSTMTRATAAGLTANHIPPHNR